jgi:hypothetical protein
MEAKPGMLEMRRSFKGHLHLPKVGCVDLEMWEVCEGARK